MSYSIAQMKDRDGWATNNPDEIIEHLIHKFRMKEDKNEIMVDYGSSFGQVHIEDTKNNYEEITKEKLADIKE
jgi:hypothetical protein